MFEAKPGFMSSLRRDCEAIGEPPWQAINGAAVREAKTTHKRIQITIETDQILTIRRSSRVRRWCPECRRDVDVVDLAQAEALTGTAQPRLRDCDQAKKWHCFEGSDGNLFICVESLLKSM
jgi:hypothetical protein